ncbi:Glutamate racemase [Acididesulfobacillus acetoxydans]|uniref:Glutamate racemase n=1 Tax=Acididesulfobacillus acetoxydans TaxID=1561005 RepID=A0A8S0XA50_9FIRM|nr:glutamate racemase [Acididesulfobacillus acetoxydans]CAA7599506.1 Glutamate racemase [Acididesulfobacillus acetoxydans]CEJ09265.1 Glutamate racemase [Acididesulfobacillus acetoxydans]
MTLTRRHIIGVFDSGVGGLTVMKEIQAQIPEVRIVYFGDTARVPYGNRPKDELIRFGEEIVTFLIGQGAEGIVVACNTSSSTALPWLRERFDIPIIGMIEPGARLAVEATRRGQIGLIATEATVRSRAYSAAISQVLARGVVPKDRRLVEAWQNGEHAIALSKAQACPLFVPLVEAGLAGSAEARGIARTYLASLKETGVDTLILGCTHYPFLAPVIGEILGDTVKLVDPAQGVVAELKRVLRRLDERDYGQPAAKPGWKVRYFVSGDPDLFRRVGNTLLKESIGDVRYAPWTE